MSAEKTTRRYQLGKRADAMEATRRRITVAAMELHGTLGPARTTLTAVAERAGVQRQTVYRHFADEEELFAACSAHFAARHPRPDAGHWRAIADPAERMTRRARSPRAGVRAAGAARCSSQRPATPSTSTPGARLHTTAASAARASSSSPPR